jgi:hypothetical protein
MEYGSIGSRHIGQSDGTRETLILFRIVISKTDLKLDSFNEFSFFSVLHHVSDGLLKEFRSDFTSARSLEEVTFIFTSYLVTMNI